MFGYITRKGVTAGLESAGVDKATAAAVGFAAGIAVGAALCDPTAVVDGAVSVADTVSNALPTITSSGSNFDSGSGSDYLPIIL